MNCIVEEKYLKINYDLKNDLYYWELGKYLEKCIPKYIVIDGWNSYISNVTKKEDLPKQCLFYIKMIEFTTSVKISDVSVGPTRENKIRM